MSQRGSSSHGSVAAPLTERNLSKRNVHSRGSRKHLKPYRRDSRSTIDFSEISGKSTNSLWKRSISASNEARASEHYKYKLEKKFRDADPMSQHGGSMSYLWEMVNRIIVQPQGGDDEAMPWLERLLNEDPEEATHKADNAPPYWTLLHKACFYGAPRCASLLVSKGGNLHARDDIGNRPIDLARFGQSPAHRDITVQLVEALEQWRADQELRKVEEAKEREEAMLSEEEEEATLASNALSDEDDVEEIDLLTRSTKGGGGGGDNSTVHTKASGSYIESSSEKRRSHTSHGSRSSRHRNSSLLPEINDSGGGREVLAEQQPQPPLQQPLTTATIERPQTVKNRILGMFSNPFKPPIIPKQEIDSQDQSRGGTQTIEGDVNTVANSEGDWGSLGSGFSESIGIRTHATPSTNYTRAENNSVDTSVRLGKRLAKAKLGAQSRFVNPKVKKETQEREMRNKKLVAEIHRTDFRCGTYNRDLLPHVAATVDALASTIDALDPRLARHLEQDSVDEEGEYKTEATVVHGGMSVDRYLSDAAGPYSGPQAGPRPRTVANTGQRRKQQTPKSPTYGGTGRKPQAGDQRRPASSPHVARQSPSVMQPNNQHSNNETNKQVNSSHGDNKMAPHLSLSAKRRSDIEVTASRSQASELRYRETASMHAKPGWISGSQLQQSTLLYKEARISGLLAASSMSEVARLGRDAPLGWGSHAYRIGGENEHSADKRLTALTALREQKAKKWWKNKD